MEKKFLRKEILEERDGIESRYKEGLDRRIEARIMNSSLFKKADKIFMCSGSGSEVNTSEFIEDFLKKGKKVFVPKVDEENKTVKIMSADSPNKVVKNENFDLVLLTGVAFDRAGGRVGYGNGNFDDYISTLKEDTPKAALCYNFQLIDKMDEDEYKTRVDYLITDQRFILTELNV